MHCKSAGEQGIFSLKLHAHKILITKREGNPTVKKPGRQHLNQVTKASLIDKGANVQPAAPAHLMGSREKNVAPPP